MTASMAGTNRTANLAPPPRSRRRGTRGLAAVAVGMAGFVVAGVSLAVLPESGLDRLALSWLIPLSVAFAIAHAVAVYGLLAGRAWSGSLTGYLAAIGIGVSTYGLLITLTGLDPFAATSALPAAEARAEGLGLLVWMIGLWALGARFALRAFRPVRLADPDWRLSSVG
jgi:uncharacterized membrane protein YagU involved in acid resistance